VLDALNRLRLVALHEQSLAIWLEGLALVAIFGLELLALLIHPLWGEIKHAIRCVSVPTKAVPFVR
jgi:hypothetical protein